MPSASPDAALPRGAITCLALTAFGSGLSLRVNDALLPHLAREFGISLGAAAQVISLFAIAYGFAQLFFGPLGDRFGKYRVVGWAAAACALSALACAAVVDLAARARFGPSLTLCVVTIVGGLVGLLFPGLFASGSGMVDSGNFDLFIAQGIAGMAVLLYAVTVSLLLALALRFTVGLTRIRYGAGRGLPAQRPVRPEHPAPSVADAREAGPAS